ncbi:MAG TPA: SAM-dependent methyltransferase [Bacteroidia bacterium]|nr:SAM-dependent methyltransferase [Bacteroidia bacterium]HNS13595.1 SAM-dependent methyltransferase [Bacteroidia bacterium]
MKHGGLYLIPTFLTEDNFLVLPDEVIRKCHSLKYFVVEEEKTARRFLKRIKHPTPQPDFVFHLHNEHTGKEGLPAVIQLLKEGISIGLLSEAGCPGVADPGSALVSLAHEQNIRVYPLVGPSSILLSLMGSGLCGQSFCFHGYLPRDPKQRQQRMKELEKLALKSGQTQIFIETPYRNMQLLEDLMNTLQDETKLCIACELTGNNESIRTKTIRVWKKNLPDFHKKPCIFLLGNS